MSEPIVLISNQRIKEGKLDEYTQSYRENVEILMADKPGTVAHLAYVSEDGSEVSMVHVFPDAESMDLHFQGVKYPRRHSSSWR
jgi:quinol monooxygenase YgiN